MLKRAGLFGFVLLFAFLSWGKEPEKKGNQYADLSFTVLKAENGKPVRNASVILHELDSKGRDNSGGFQLKTDAEGKTGFNSFPYGKLRIQVIAPGLRTYGADYDVNQPTLDIVIKLETPQKQYSIYK